MLLPRLNFKEKYDFRLKKDKGRYFIYDLLRKKWLLLTPEEWVRRHWIEYFMKQGKTVSSLVIEKKIMINNTIKRFDLIVLSKNGIEFLVECKAPVVKINENHFEQAARYNSVLKAEKMIISNGIDHFQAEFRLESYVFSILKFN